jgi:hypothetical protein
MIANRQNGATGDVRPRTIRNTGVNNYNNPSQVFNTHIYFHQTETQDTKISVFDWTTIITLNNIQIWYIRFFKLAIFLGLTRLLINDKTVDDSLSYGPEYERLLLRHQETIRSLCIWHWFRRPVMILFVSNCSFILFKFLIP